ncbi:MAG: NAD(P)H-binding protein [Dehalococcoidia bacterium]|nr:NAD(P)H-binding protein [Dehalococcoidia bacterium]
MKIVVAGGTGFLGSEIIESALEAGHTVSRRLAVEARPMRSSRIESRATRWILATLKGKFDGQDVLVDAVQFPNMPMENPSKGYTFERVDLGGTRNLVDAAKEAGVGHFIGLSGVGAAQDAPYHWLRFKWEEEQYIKESGVPFTVFRPSWVYGPDDVSLNRFLGFARFLPFVPVIGNGKTRINPLFVKDIGAAARAAVDRGPANRVFELGGPETLIMDDVIRTALRVKGQRRFLLHQPKALMKVAASFAQYVPGRPLTPDAIDFITQDGVADITAFTETFGMRPTPLEDGLRTYLNT